jgi:Tfp pilus assembly PilM family ATPase
LAIDFDSGGLFVVAANAANGSIAFERALASADEVPPLNAASASALGLRLKTLLQEAKISAAPVLLCLGRDRIVVKEVKYPIGPPEQEPALVRFQAQKDLTDSPDDVVMDYLPVPGQPGDVSRKATVLFVRKELANAAKQMCDVAGLKLQAIVPRPYAATTGLFHAVVKGAVPAPENAKAAIAHLGIWSKGGEFSVVLGDRLLFSRTISGMSLASETALVGEVKRSLAAFASQNGQAKIESLTLCEGDVPGGGWAGRLQAALPIPVYPYDPLGEAGPQEHVPARLRGRFFGAVGLLAAKAESLNFGVNFVAPRAPKSEPNKNRSRILVGALLMMLVLGAGFVFGRSYVDRTTRKVNELTAMKTDLDERLVGLQSDSNRLAAADEFANREIAWIDVFYDLNDEFPNIDKMRLQEMEGTIFVPQVAPKAITQTPAPGAPGQAPKPIAKPGAPDLDKKGAVRILLVAEEPAMPQKLNDTLSKEKGMGNVRLTIGGLVGSSGSKVQQFTINLDLFRRKPEEYSRKIPPPPPPPKVVVPEKVVEPGEEDPFVGPPAPVEAVPVEGGVVPPATVPVPVPDDSEDLDSMEGGAR